LARSWGATEAEREAIYPGDDLVPNPRLRTTRAVEIAATPEQIWPWVAQLGVGRGGVEGGPFFKLLVNRGQGPPAKAPLAEFQNIAEGDVIDVSTSIFLQVVKVDQPNCLVLVSDRRNFVSHPFAANYSVNIQASGPVSSRVVIRENVDWSTSMIGVVVKAGDYLKGYIVPALLAAMKRNVEAWETR